MADESTLEKVQLLLEKSKLTFWFKPRFLVKLAWVHHPWTLNPSRYTNKIRLPAFNARQILEHGNRTRELAPCVWAASHNSDCLPKRQQWLPWPWDIPFLHTVTELFLHFDFSFTQLLTGRIKTLPPDVLTRVCQEDSYRGDQDRWALAKRLIFRLCLYWVVFIMNCLLGEKCNRGREKQIIQKAPSGLVKHFFITVHRASANDRQWDSGTFHVPVLEVRRLTTLPPRKGLECHPGQPLALIPTLPVSGWKGHTLIEI